MGVVPSPAPDRAEASGAALGRTRPVKGRRNGRGVKSAPRAGASGRGRPGGYPAREASAGPHEERTGRS